jgi:hypothetical protein
VGGVREVLVWLPIPPHTCGPPPPPPTTTTTTTKTTPTHPRVQAAINVYEMAAASGVPLVVAIGSIEGPATRGVTDISRWAFVALAPAQCGRGWRLCIVHPPTHTPSQKLLPLPGDASLSTSPPPPTPTHTPNHDTLAPHAQRLRTGAWWIPNTHQTLGREHTPAATLHERTCCSALMRSAPARP